mgnify:CR=1 FL=1
MISPVQTVPPCCGSGFVHPLLNKVPLAAIDKYGLGSIVVTGIALIMTYLVLKKNKTTFRAIGLRWEKKTPLRFAAGYFSGIIITALILAITIHFSNLELRYIPNQNILSVLFWLLAFLPLAFMEELIFRGYAFIKMKRDFGIWPAQIVLALLFAWYHDFTGLTLLNQLLGPGTWALIFGITAAWTRGLAFPTGLHMAINVVLAVVGEKDNRHSLWNIAYTNEINPTLSNQTETIGVTIQIVLLLIAIILTEYYRRNKQIVS